MATREMTVCDVYGTTKDVKRYQLQLVEIDKTGAQMNTPQGITYERDLCKKARDRVHTWMFRAMSRPKAQPKSTEKGGG